MLGSNKMQGQKRCQNEQEALRVIGERGFVHGPARWTIGLYGVENWSCVHMTDD
jgi:hypothetical protein